MACLEEVVRHKILRKFYSNSLLKQQIMLDDYFTPFWKRLWGCLLELVCCVGLLSESLH